MANNDLGSNSNSNSNSGSRSKKLVQEILALADIEIGGKDPWDIQVYDERLYDRLLSGGALALGESYMDGWWDAASLDQMFDRVLTADLGKKIKINFAMVRMMVAKKLFNFQSRSRAFEVGQKHYDIGNDLYEAMLDKRMVYTCAYWDGMIDGKPVANLDEAQEAKLDLVCKKIGLKKGQRVLDIGCGWGSFLKFAAERYGAIGVGVTVSKEQKALAAERCKGLPIEIRLQDYRDLGKDANGNPNGEKFDHIISLGMFEHVGYKNYRTYMEVAERCLKDDGIFLLHTIGSLLSVHASDPWFEKYIFTNSMLPSVKQIAAASEGLFVMEDWHNFGASYDLTLVAWFKNFDKAWPVLAAKHGDKASADRFYKMWKYYLLSLAGGFRARKVELWQVVFSKNGVRGGYKSVR